MTVRPAVLVLVALAWGAGPARAQVGSDAGPPGEAPVAGPGAAAAGPATTGNETGVPEAETGPSNAGNETGVPEAEIGAAATNEIGASTATETGGAPADENRPTTASDDGAAPAGTERGPAAPAGVAAADAGAPIERDGGEVPSGEPVAAGSDSSPGPEAAATTSGASADGGAALPAAVASTDVVRTLLGLVLLLALAWLGGLPSVRRLEERLGISQMVTSGLPFVGLGLLMHAPGIDVLTDETLVSITPLLQFGLGWIGFHTGFQFSARAMDEVPRGTGTLVVLLTSFPFVLIAVSCGLVILLTGLGPTGISGGSGPTEDAILAILRDSAIVGLAGALSAPTLDRVPGASARAIELSRAIGILDDVFGVIALACLSAWLRPGGTGGWTLPGVGWVFITFGMAVTLGLVVYALLRNTDSSAERTSLLIGSVSFAAGMAGAFELPPLVVCFLAGVLLRNLPGEEKHELRAVFDRLERPIYLVFLLIVGALWRIDDWRGWALLPVFVLARIVGRWLGARAARRLPAESRPPELESTSARELVTPPMGQLAIAFVVTAQALYESPAIRAIVTAVIGGSILAEILVQVGARRTRSTAPPEPAPTEPVAAEDPAVAETQLAIADPEPEPEEGS